MNDKNSKNSFGSWRFITIAGALILLMSAGQIQGLATGGDAAVGCGTPPEETVEQSEAPAALSAKDAVAAGCNCSDQFVNIKTWCGRNSKQNAKGDGVTDDGPAIQNALECLYSLEKIKKVDESGAVGTLFFPAGVYLIKQSIKVPTTTHYQGLKITGESQQTSVLFSNQADTLIQFGSDQRGASRSSRFELSQLALIHRPTVKGNTAKSAVTVYHGQFSHIHDLSIFSEGPAINFEGLEFSTLERIHVWPPWGAYVFSTLLPSTKSSLNALAQQEPSMFRLSSEKFPILDVRFEDCIVNGGGTAYALEKGERPFANVSIQGGFLQNLSADAISMAATASRIRNVEISNVHFEHLNENSRAINAENIDRLSMQNIDIPNQGIYGLRLADAMRVSVRNSANFGVLELENPDVLNLLVENSYFGGVSPEDALDNLKERQLMGSTILGFSHAYGIKTAGTVIAQKVISDGIQLGQALGLAKRSATEDQDFPPGTTTRTPVNFDEVELSTEPSLAGETIKISRAGYYRFSVNITLKSVVAGAWVKLFLYKNGGEAERLSWDSAVANTPRRTYSRETIVKANTGDEFSVRLTHSARTALVSDSSYGNFINIQYLGD